MRIRFVLAASATVLTAACTSTTGGTGFTPVGASVPPSAPSSPPAGSTAPASSTPAPTGAPSTHATSDVPAMPVASSAPTATRQVVMRPVDRDGRPAPGYTVQTESGSVSCSEPSPVAVDPDIRMCSPAAEYAVACWRSADPGWVLCLRDPLFHTLARIRLSGGFTPVAAPRGPSPLRIVLSGDVSCVIRDGGSWELLPGHPQWFGTYGCNMRDTVYGPANSDGIDRTHPLWTVHVVPDSALGVNGSGKPVDIRPVRTGYFVGTAG